MTLLDLEQILEEKDNLYAEDFNRYLDVEAFELLAKGKKGIKLQIKKRHAELFKQGEIDNTIAKQYLHTNGITDFRYVTGKNKDVSRSAFVNLSQGFGSATGLWKGVNKGSSATRKSLVDNGILESRLANYDTKTQQELFESMFEHCSVTVDYFNADIVGQEAAKENRELLLNSKIPREYLHTNGITDFRHITGENKDGSSSAFANLSLGFGSATGLWKGVNNGSSATRKSLVDNGILESRLANYDAKTQQELFESMFEHRSVTVDYLNADIVGQEAAKENKNLFLSSDIFTAYLSDNNAILSDASTHSQKVKSFLKKINYIENKITREDPQITTYRKINTVWHENEEEQLLAIVDEHGGFENFLNNIPKEELLTTFGRSIGAIISKAQRLLNIEYDQNGFRDSGIVKYKNNLEDLLDPYYQTYFHNNADRLHQAMMPQVTLVVGYESIVHGQFMHAILPIYNRGSDFNNYNAVEQLVISTVANYISDNTVMKKNENGNRDATNIAPFTDPRILQLKKIQIGNNKREYIELIYRRSFNPYNKTDTESINTSKRNEVWFMKEKLTSLV